MTIRRGLALVGIIITAFFALMGFLTLFYDGWSVEEIQPVQVDYPGEQPGARTITVESSP